MTYGATARTLRTFIGSYHDLMNLIRDFMVPNPDLKIEMGIKRFIIVTKILIFTMHQ